VGGAFNEAEDEAAFLGGIQALADEAAACQVVIGLEIHGTLTRSGRTTRDLIEKVHHPAVRINYDTANSEYFGGVPVMIDLPDALPFVAHCHLKDKVGEGREWIFQSLCEGHIDCGKQLSRVELADYRSLCYDG